MTAPIYVKPPARRSLSFSMAPDVLAQIKEAAAKDNVPASRLVEAIVVAALAKRKGK